MKWFGSKGFMAMLSYVRPSWAPCWHRPVVSDPVHCANTKNPPAGFRWDRHPDIYFDIFWSFLIYFACASWSSCHLTPHTPQISPVPHDDSEFANPDISWLSISFSFHPTFSLPSYGCHHVRIQRLDNRKLLAALWRFRFFGYVPGRSGFEIWMICYLLLRTCFTYGILISTDVQGGV